MSSSSCFSAIGIIKSMWWEKIKSPQPEPNPDHLPGLSFCSLHQLGCALLSPHLSVVSVLLPSCSVSLARPPPSPGNSSGTSLPSHPSPGAQAGSSGLFPPPHPRLWQEDAHNSVSSLGLL